MATTSTRTLRLLSLLQAHRSWPGPELAARLGVSSRTLRRDVERLRELGYPVQARPGTDGGYQLAAGAVLPPLALDDDEAVAIAVGLQAAAQGAVPGLAEPSVQALAKLVQVMPARLRRRVDALLAMTVPATWGPAVEQARITPEVLTALAQTCRDRERVELAYTAADGRRSTRSVEPHRLVPLGRRWYLVGYDLGRHDWRTYRVDRITAPRGTGVTFGPRTLPAADAATYVRSRLQQPWGHEVEALVEAPARDVAAMIGRYGTVEDIGGGRCRVRLQADDLDWPAFALARLGAGFTVVGPPALVEHLRGWAQRCADATTDAPARRPGVDP